MNKRKSMHLCGGGGASLYAISNESQVNSRKYNMINKVRSTQNELTSTYSRLTTKALGFTMAEILLSLTIIGVVAAITLPSLTGNINERTWNTQRKALYARMSQAIALMPALNHYGTSTDTAAETFITAGLSKVLKINNICGSSDISECGFPAKILNLNTTPITTPTTLEDLNPLFTNVEYNSSLAIDARPGSYQAANTNAAAFETANGESILLFYNPNCVSNMNETNNHYSQPKMCVNMVYDLNGKKGPNTMNKDIGIITVFYPSDSVVVAPVPYNRVLNSTADAPAKTCTVTAGDEYRIPTKEETAALVLNNTIIGASSASGTSRNIFTSSKFLRSNGSTVNWVAAFTCGAWLIPSAGANWSIWCVKR